MINTVLANQPGRRAAVRVSPYMLYHFARRYDEFPGDADEGSSLRGVFKGWFNHGVARDDDWTLDPIPDLEESAFIDKSREFPLGAFYRVNPYRLDDVQSAISELHAIAVSAAIHDGWRETVVVKRARQKEMHVISRPVNAKSVGGHAFALVGYNEVGFLVQNSWGTAWGKGGFATLPYEDWLESAYDAWVARPGVPNTPFASGWKRTAVATGHEMATVPAPDERRLKAHVVNLGNNGKLSEQGKFVSTPLQLQEVVDHMERWHEFWIEQGTTTQRDIVLYAHGGLVAEQGGLETAQKQLNWWLNNQVYPITFVWQTGVIETLLSQLTDLNIFRMPAGGIGFDLVEQFDRRIEGVARSSLRWLWEEMKENARHASGDNPAAGGTMMVNLIREYIDKHGADSVRIHLVGHSAGSILVAGLLNRFADAGQSVRSLSLLAPAIRVDEFAREIVPHLGGAVGSFATFGLSDKRELDDACGAGPIDIYHKSLLYLVSRALEHRSPEGGSFEVPLLGMERFFDQAPVGGDGRTLRELVAIGGGEAIFSRATGEPRSRSDAKTHGGFDDDQQTMTSVAMRILGVSELHQVREYQAHSPLETAGPAPFGRVFAPERTPDAPLRAAAGIPDPIAPIAEANAPGTTPLVETAPPQTQVPEAPAQPGLSREVAIAPTTGSPTLDVLESAGYKVVVAE
jgi:pimeloyl-ACP methyl ester carboxylesterase